MTTIKSHIMSAAMPVIMAFSLVLALSVVPGTLNEASAATEVTRHHSIDTSGVTKIEVKNGVGTVSIAPTTGETLSAEVFIEGNRSGVFRRKTDVSEFDIEVERSGNTLKLSFGENNTQANWHIQMPVIDALYVNLGVGQVDIEVLDTAVDVNNGVGEVNISAKVDYTGKISVNTGVGNAKITGAFNVETKRAIVSERSEATGEGNRTINVEVGVGDAQVKLN